MILKESTEHDDDDDDDDEIREASIQSEANVFLHPGQSGKPAKSTPKINTKK